MLLLAAAALLLDAPAAQALPSYARQTGQECAACHNGFPELTPYGRLFKANGYVFGGGGSSNIPPLAAMAIPSFTHTDSGQAPGTAGPHLGPNDNFAFQGSLFYGGAIYSPIGLGAFAQASYSSANRNFNWDNTDIRDAHASSLFDRETVFGATLNNNPGVTDLWNSTPAWGYPFVTSPVAPVPGAATLIEGGLAQQVLGITVYNYWNRLIYTEFGGYRTLGPRTESALGIAPTGLNAIKNIAPYWRIAVSPAWGQNSFEAGFFGIAATLIPGRVSGFGTDHLTDFGYDTQYQWLGARDSFSVQAYWIDENQNFSASSALGGASNTHDHLHSFRAKTTYWYDQTYGGTVAYFRTQGSTDLALYSGISPVNNIPNSDGWIGEVDYMPFSHGGPALWPWLNMKLGVQYIWYDRFDGARTNIDGAGRSANANNTLFVFAWFAF